MRNMGSEGFLLLSSILNATPSLCCSDFARDGDFTVPILQMGHSRHKMGGEAAKDTCGTGRGLDPLCLLMLFSDTRDYGWLCTWTWGFSLLLPSLGEAGKPKGSF